MKAFLGMLAAALGAAALLVACHTCGGDTAASESNPLSAETRAEDECAVCQLFDFDFDIDPQVDDD